MSYCSLSVMPSRNYCNTCFRLPGRVSDSMAVASGSRGLPATLGVCKIRSSKFPHVIPTGCSSLSLRGQHGRGQHHRGQHRGRGGGLSVQREPAGTAIPHEEKPFGACCSPTRRARDAGPAGRRGARVPGGLDQQLGSAGASGRCAEPDSLLGQDFGADDDSSGNHDDHWQLSHHRSCQPAERAASDSLSAHGRDDAGRVGVRVSNAAKQTGTADASGR